MAERGFYRTDRCAVGVDGQNLVYGLTQWSGSRDSWGTPQMARLIARGDIAFINRVWRERFGVDLKALEGRVGSYLARVRENKVRGVANKLSKRCGRRLAHFVSGLSEGWVNA